MYWLHIDGHYNVKLLRGGNTSSRNEKNPVNKRRELIVLAALIEHPTEGLILFETGCAEDVDVVGLICTSFTFSSSH